MATVSWNPTAYTVRENLAIQRLKNLNFIPVEMCYCCITFSIITVVIRSIRNALLLSMVAARLQVDINICEKERSHSELKSPRAPAKSYDNTKTFSQLQLLGKYHK